MTTEMTDAMSDDLGAMLGDAYQLAGEIVAPLPDDPRHVRLLDLLDAAARLADPRSAGTSIGHDADVLPQGMTFNAAELGDAYAAGAEDARAFARQTPAQVPDDGVARARDGYVKLAHLRRLPDLLDASASRAAAQHPTQPQRDSA